jgi:hypothetical protein
MDRMPLDVVVPVLLCVVIAGVVDAACFEEDSPINSVNSNGKTVGFKNPGVLLRNIPVCVYIVHREKSFSLIFAEGVDLLAYGFL